MSWVDKLATKLGMTKPQVETLIRQVRLELPEPKPTWRLVGAYIKKYLPANRSAKEIADLLRVAGWVPEKKKPNKRSRRAVVMVITDARPAPRSVEIHGITPLGSNTNVHAQLASVARARTISMAVDPATGQRLAVLTGVVSELADAALRQSYQEVLGNTPGLLVSVDKQMASRSVHATSVPIGGQPPDKPVRRR
jgi:hypothetical protein